MMFDEDGLKRAGGRYLQCPFCGTRDWLKVRVAVKYDLLHKERNEYYSVHCESCQLTYGESWGEPVYESESELIAGWNVRRY